MLSTIRYLINFNPSTNIFQNISRVILGIFLTYAGIGHLSFSRIEFQAQVPTWLLIDADFAVVVSGIIEILLGMLLIFLHQYRSIMGWNVAIFFVLIYHGNISQYTNGIDAFGLDTDRDRFIRLLFQLVLVWWALWSSGGWEAWKSRNNNSKLETKYYHSFQN